MLRKKNLLRKKSRRKKRAELKKKENEDCSIQFPQYLTIPERIIKEMKSKNVSGCLIRYNNIWFSPVREFGEKLNEDFEHKQEQQKEEEEDVPFNSSDYINLGEEHPDLNEDSEDKPETKAKTMAGRFFQRRKKGAKQVFSNIGKTIKGATNPRNNVLGAALTLGMVGEASKKVEAYDFGNTKEININIKDVDHEKFPINRFRSAWNSMSEIKDDKVIQVNWTNTTGRVIIPMGVVKNGKIRLRMNADDELLENKNQSDEVIFDHKITKKYKIIIPETWSQGTALDIDVKSYLSEDILLLHPVYIMPISIKNPYKKSIENGETVRLYLRGTLNDINSTSPEEKPNFILLNNQANNSVAQIIFDGGKFESCSIEEMKHNIAHYLYELIHKKQLISLYNIYSALSKNLKPEEKKSRKVFAEHEQYAILKDNDKSVKRRIFYKKNTNALEEDIKKINQNLDNIFVYVFDSKELFPGKHICLNKKYGVVNINAEFWRFKDVKTMDYERVNDNIKKNAIKKMKYIS